jgi:hypothetical protein
LHTKRSKLNVLFSRIMFTQAALLALASLAPLVKAHGTMSRIVIDGTEYKGPLPNSNDGQQYAIREVNTVDPVKGTDNGFLSCGSGAQPAALVADANPGSEVGFGWINGEQGPWVHNTGPVLTYMASCGSGSCTTFDSANAEWFKIDQKGRHDGNGAWFMSDYNQDVNSLLSVTLPTNLPAGEYLLRHELIGMHNGLSEGGAEFYPACAQIRLSASSRADAKVPSGSDVVTFPGGYAPLDPGITDPEIYNPGSEYVFPGPPVVNDSEGASGSDTGSTDPVGSDASNPGTPTSSDNAAPTETAGSGSGCGGNSSRKMKKRVVKRIIRQEVRKLASKAKRSSGAKPAQVQAAVKRDVHHPVRNTNSRVMRGLNLN